MDRDVEGVGGGPGLVLTHRASREGIRKGSFLFTYIQTPARRQHDEPSRC